MALKVAIINGKEPSGGSGGVSGADFQHVGVNFLTAGIASSAHALVTQQSTPDMTVKVATGKVYVFKSDTLDIFHTEITTNTNVTITANSSGNPRIDAIVLKVDLGTTPNATADNIATIVAVTGTPAGSPVAPTDPAIQTAIGAGNAFYRLANVTVANGASSILTANIADTRAGVQFKLLGSYLKYNLGTSKIQFSNDGTTYNDIGSGTATFAFPVEGVLSTGTNVVSPAPRAPFALKVIKVLAYVDTAPTGADLVFDLNKNGTSCWATTQANRVKIVASASSGSQTNFDTTTFAEGDKMTLDIDQVGSTVAGSDAMVEVYCQAT